MLDAALDHLLHNVLPAAADYDVAEDELTRAIAASPVPADWEQQARQVKRRAAELAIAIDGLAERCKTELGISLTNIRQQVSAMCTWPGTAFLRAGSFDRIRGVANAYKHQNLTDPTLPIAADADVLVVALGFGLDGYGVGKFDGVEVLVRDKSATSWKFMGDAPVAIGAWCRFLGARGATLPAGPYRVCNLQVYP